MVQTLIILCYQCLKTEARFTAQTVLDGVPAGNTFIKVYVVRDLNYKDEDETLENIGNVGEN